MKTYFVLFIYTLFLVLAFIKCHSDRQSGIPRCILDSEIENLCEEDEEYDSEIRAMFDKAIENSQMSSFYLKTLIDLTTDPNQYTELQNISPSVVDLCPSVSKIIYPKRGKNKEGEFVFLLNQNRTQQGLMVDLCIGRVNGITRDNMCNSLDFVGEITFCKQKYIYRNMVSIDEKGTQLASQAIELPSCCSCKRETVHETPEF